MNCRGCVSLRFIAIKTHQPGGRHTFESNAELCVPPAGLTCLKVNKSGGLRYRQFMDRLSGLKRVQLQNAQASGLSP